jgi:glycogen(starch) synthase
LPADAPEEPHPVTSSDSQSDLDPPISDPVSSSNQTVNPAVTPLSILMITARYTPEIGGTEIHTKELAERLVQRGHQVTVLTTDRSGTLPSSETRSGVLIQRVRAWPRTADYYFAPGILRAKGRGRFDLIHVQGIHTFVAPLGMAVALIHRIPFVMAFHSGGHSSRWRRAIRRPQLLVLRPLLNQARRLIANSDHELTYFQSHLHIPAPKYAVVPVGSNLDVITEAEPEGDGSILILSVGRLEQYKGHNRLIEAWPAILESIPNGRLRIVGEGPRRQDLLSLIARLGIEDSVEIGPIPTHRRTQLAGLMKRAALVVSLSTFESAGMAIREALALGTPALITNIPGFSDLIGGPLVSVLPVACTAAQVSAGVIRAVRNRLVADPAPLPTWEQCVDAFEEIYRAALTNHP